MVMKDKDNTRRCGVSIICSISMGPEFDSQHPLKKPGGLSFVCNPSTGVADTSSLAVSLSKLVSPRSH